MKVGILGLEKPAQLLSWSLTRLGHQVVIGVENHENKLRTRRIEYGVEKSKIQLAMYSDAASFGDIIILCTSWVETRNVIKLAGSSNLRGKIVVDTTNPIDNEGKLSRCSVSENSGGEIIQGLLPSSKIIKAFNTIVNPYNIHSVSVSDPVTMFICGNDKSSKKTLIDGFLVPLGWDGIDLGGIDQSRFLESLVIFWTTYFTKTKTQDCNCYR